VGRCLRNGREALDVMERRCLTRLLGHPPTRDDAARLPGIDVSDLLGGGSGES
jgi:hypothetical protein